MTNMELCLNCHCSSCQCSTSLEIKPEGIEWPRPKETTKDELLIRAAEIMSRHVFRSGFKTWLEDYRRFIDG